MSAKLAGAKYHDYPLEVEFYSETSGNSNVLLANNLSEKKFYNGPVTLNTDSSSSLDASFPYYNLSSKGGTLDTESLLSPQNGSAYRNTTHLVESDSLQDSNGKALTHSRNAGSNPENNPQHSHLHLRNEERSNFSPNFRRLSIYSSYLSSLLSANTLMGTGLRNERRSKTSAMPPVMTSRSDSVATFFSTGHQKTGSKSRCTDKISPGVFRRKAIRIKTLKQFEKFKSKIRRLVRFFLRLKFKNFKASSRRIGSLSSTLSRRKGSIRQSKPRRENLIRRLSKSRVPITKPMANLHIDDSSPQLASDDLFPFQVSNTNVAISRLQQVRANLRYGNDRAFHSYLHSQQERMIDHAYTKSRYNSIGYNEGKVVYSRKPSKSEEFEVPPTPPLHSVMYAKSHHDMPLEFVEAWKVYLSLVILKRIKLRQEISTFQQLSVQLSKNTIPNLNSQRPSKDTMRHSISKGEEMDDTLSLRTDSTYDSATEEFNRRFKRESILSEMLDYESSLAEDEDSSECSSVRFKEAHHTNEELFDYPSSTQFDHASKFEDANLASQNDRLDLHPLRRSKGYNTDLHKQYDHI